jgi:hypothetical protein
VLITTDSILHAMHRTYDDLLMEMEQMFLAAALDQLLTKCHDALATSAQHAGAAARNCQDVDLYLTVARNLLHGAGAPTTQKSFTDADIWNGNLLVGSKLGQDQDVKQILHLIQSLTLQLPSQGQLTKIYGGKRAIDYSQFRPRGHYTKSVQLSRYFRVRSAKRVFMLAS